MKRLASHDLVFIQKTIEWRTFGTRNIYTITDPGGTELCRAIETEGSLAGDVVWMELRQFILVVLEPGGKPPPLFRIESSSRFVDHRASVLDSAGRRLAVISYVMLRNKIKVLDRDEKEMFLIRRPFFHPRTFHIERQRERIGSIVASPDPSCTRKGFIKDFFSRVFFFKVSFPQTLDVESKASLLGATILIDFSHFELTHMVRSHRR